MLHRKNVFILFIIITVIAISLRVLFISHLFWIDESFTATVITQPLSIITVVVSKDVHPPLYYYLLHYWNKIGLLFFKNDGENFSVLNYTLEHQGSEGTFEIKMASGRILSGFNGIIRKDNWSRFHISSLVFLRTFNVLFGIASIILLFFISNTLFKEYLSISILSSFLMAISPFSIFWDTVIRSYTLLNFFVLLTTLTLVKTLKQFSFYKCFIFGILIIISSLTNSIGLFFLPIYACIIFFNKWGDKKSKVYTFISLIFGFIIFVLLWGETLSNQTTLVSSQNPATVYIFLTNFLTGLGGLPSLFWKFMFSSAPWIELNSFSLPITYLVTFSLFSLLIAFSIIDSIKDYSFEKIAIIGLMFIPMIIPVLFNSIKPNSLYMQSRYFYSSFPFFCLFLSFGMRRFLELTLHR